MCVPGVHKPLGIVYPPRQILRGTHTLGIVYPPGTNSRRKTVSVCPPASQLVTVTSSSIRGLKDLLIKKG